MDIANFHVTDIYQSQKFEYTEFDKYWLKTIDLKGLLQVYHSIEDNFKVLGIIYSRRKGRGLNIPTRLPVYIVIELEDKLKIRVEPWMVEQYVKLLSIKSNFKVEKVIVTKANPAKLNRIEQKLAENDRVRNLIEDKYLRFNRSNYNLLKEIDEQLGISSYGEDSLLNLMSKKMLD